MLLLPRRIVLRSLAAVVLVLAVGGCLNEHQQAVFDHVNASRHQAGLAGLAEDPTATKQAQAWADELAARGSIGHSNVASTAGDGWQRVGENVGKAVDAPTVHRRFMESTTHRDNILGNWSHLGVGVSRGGDGMIYVVHVFVQKAG